MDAEQGSCERAQSLLARELGCAPDEIAVVQTEATEWPDSALGCPQPGMMYLQVITPGYRITLRHGDQQYVVHTDRGQRAVRCDTPQHRRNYPRARR